MTTIILTSKHKYEMLSVLLVFAKRPSSQVQKSQTSYIIAHDV